MRKADFGSRIDLRPHGLASVRDLKSAFRNLKLT